MIALLQVELAALDYRSSRLVRVLNSKTGQRGGFGEGGTTEVVSARSVSSLPTALLHNMSFMTACSMQTA